MQKQAGRPNQSLLLLAHRLTIGSLLLVALDPPGVLRRVDLVQALQIPAIALQLIQVDLVGYSDVESRALEGVG